MAKNQNTYEKRRRESAKKFKADLKRKKREAKKQEGTRPANGGFESDQRDAQSDE